MASQIEEVICRASMQSNPLVQLSCEAAMAEFQDMTSVSASFQATSCKTPMLCCQRPLLLREAKTVFSNTKPEAPAGHLESARRATTLSQAFPPVRRLLSCSKLFMTLPTVMTLCCMSLSRMTSRVSTPCFHLNSKPMTLIPAL